MGNPDQKNKQTFTSLNYQIENGLKKGHSDSVICFIIIAYVSPDI